MNVDRIACELRSEGFVTVEDALAPDLRARLGAGCDDGHAAQFAPSSVGRRGQRTHDGEVRGDVIRWFDAVNEADHAYLVVMEALRVALNERLYLGLFAYDCHYAIYGAGRRYQRHLDSLSGQKNRLLSTVIYLHDQWTPADGGELVLYRGGDESPMARILPKPGLMVLFLSEEFPHEVLAARKPRHSLAGWYRGRASSRDTGPSDAR
jgi:SM-20-related protein